jgi:hypothetical protein
MSNQNNSEARRACTRGALAVVLALVPWNSVTGGEGVLPEPSGQHLFQRMRPVGGWHPDSGGLLHWWNPRCSPPCGGPDDYCRKPMPRICWPPYRPFYIWVPQRDANVAH